MTSMNQLVNEIESLPPKYIQEVMDFVAELKQKRAMNISETMILSEKSLAKDWDTPEEDEAWADL